MNSDLPKIIEYINATYANLSSEGGGFVILWFDDFKYKQSIDYILNILEGSGWFIYKKYYMNNLDDVIGFELYNEELIDNRVTDD